MGVTLTRRKGKDVKQVAGLNLLRVMRQVEKVAAELQRQTAPSEARIEELDTGSGTGEAR